MELLQLGLFATIYYSFSTGYFMSFILFYLLCILTSNSKINIERNNDMFAIFCNTLHLILNLLNILGEMIIYKMKKNTYMNYLIQIYNNLNYSYLNICCKIKGFVKGFCSCFISKELKTQTDINEFLDSINN